MKLSFRTHSRPVGRAIGRGVRRVARDILRPFGASDWVGSNWDGLSPITLLRLPKEGFFICVTVRNESLYIREWIAYHLALGFDHIFLFDNDSTDDLLGALRGIPRSKLTVIPWPRKESGLPRQHEAYTACHGSLAGFPDAWILYIDADEFLVLKQHQTILQFIDSLEPVDGVAFNWRVFGDSGRKEYSPDYVISRFTRASRSDFSGNYHVKSMAKVAKTVMPDLHWHTMVAGAIILDPEGNPLPHNLGPISTAVSHRVAQVNHYFTKTAQEWGLRRRLGRADKAVGSDLFYRSGEEFRLNNRNEVADREALKRIQALENMLAIFDSRARRRGLVAPWLSR